MGRFFSSVWQAVREFIADDCMSIGAAIAYYAMFSLPPLLVIVLMIAGYFGLKPDEIRGAVQDQWGVAATEKVGSEDRDRDRAGLVASRLDAIIRRKSVVAAVILTRPSFAALRWAGVRR